MLSRKLFSLLPLLGALAVAGAAQAAGTMSVVPVSGTPGSVVHVQVMVDAGVVFTGINLNVGFTPPPGAPALTLTSVNDITAGPLFTSMPLIAPNQTAPGNLVIGIINATSVQGPGVVVDIPLHIDANASAGTVYNVSINAQFNDDAGDLIPTPQFQNGTVTVLEPMPITEGKVSLGNASAGAGGTAILEVDGDADLQNVGGIELNLAFDRALVVDTHSIQVNPDLGMALKEANNHPSGTLRVAVALTQPFNGPGWLMRVPFHVPAHAPDGKVYAVTLSSLQVNDPTGQGLAAASENGSIKVGRMFADTAMLFVPDVKVRAGQDANVKIEASSDVKGISGAQFTLSYVMVTPASAPALPQPDAGAVVQGDLFPPGSLVAANVKSEGQVTVGIAAASAVDGPGVLAVIPLHVPADAPGNAVYELRLSSATVSKDGFDVSLNANGGTLAVQKSSRKKGDLNGDGKVSISDVTIALRLVTFGETPTPDELEAGDILGHGKITLADVTLILEAVLGLRSLGG